MADACVWTGDASCWQTDNEHEERGIVFDETEGSGSETSGMIVLVRSTYLEVLVVSTKAGGKQVLAGWNFGGRRDSENTT